MALLNKFRRGADASEPAAHDENVATDVLFKRRAIFELLDQQRCEPPVLVDHEVAPKCPWHSTIDAAEKRPLLDYSLG